MHVIFKIWLTTAVEGDNGPSFSSEEFKSYLKSVGIQHLTTAPYHACSDRAAEICMINV